jgi:hypothetical protein
LEKQRKAFASQWIGLLIGGFDFVDDNPECRRQMQAMIDGMKFPTESVFVLPPPLIII